MSDLVRITFFNISVAFTEIEKNLKDHIGSQRP